MKIKKLEAEFTVCKIKSINEVDFTKEFVFLSKTDEEISLVCESNCVPATAIVSESGWEMLKIEGPLEFSLVGVISKISTILSQAQISIFVISTYNTDYILIKSSNFNESVDLLESNGYAIV